MYLKTFKDDHYHTRKAGKETKGISSNTGGDGSKET
jgi:hypothetical protein